MGRLLAVIVISLLVALCSRVLLAAELQRASVEAESLYSKQDFFIPEYSANKRPLDRTTGPERWAYSLKLRNDFKLTDTRFGQTYWNNTVTGLSTTRQFRYVGYEFKVLHNFTPGVGVFYYHHSEHGLDIERQGYPLQDSFGVVFCFAGKECNQ